MSVTAADRIKKLLSDEATWMGIYENQAFDSANFGHRVGMFFDIGDWDRVVLGSRAPESPQVAGWKYLLVGKARSAADAIQQLGLDSPSEEECAAPHRG